MQAFGCSDLLFHIRMMH